MRQQTVNLSGYMYHCDTRLVPIYIPAAGYIYRPRLGRWIVEKLKNGNGTEG